MRKATTAVRAAAVLGCIVGAIALAGAYAAPETFREIIAKRPAPKLDGLAERSSPHQKGDVATESFWDLLKLRDQPTRAAVPELTKILSAHAGSTRIHRFAAAQALFTAGGDEAARILEKHLLAPEYPAHMAITYSSHWQMGELERSRFVETYLLRDLADDLDVDVRARWSEAGTKKRADDGNSSGRQLHVTVTYTNTTGRPLAVLVDHQYQAKSLHFRGPSGAFAVQSQLVVYGPDPARFVRLKAGASTSFDVVLELKDDPKSLATARRNASEPAKIQAFLASTDTGFALSEFGTYKLSAMIVRTPLADEQKKSLRQREGIEADEVWMGRAVSKAIDVDLR